MFRNKSNNYTFFQAHGLRVSLLLLHWWIQLLSWLSQVRQNKNKTIPGRTQPVSSTSLVACHRPETKVRMKPELTSFLCVAMTTAAQSTCAKSHHPQGGNSQISPGNQNIISCYLHGNTKLIFHICRPVCLIDPCQTWPFSYCSTGCGSRCVVLLAGAEAGWAGCSLNVTPSSLSARPCLQEHCWFTLTYWQPVEEILFGCTPVLLQYVPRIR